MRARGTTSAEYAKTKLGGHAALTMSQNTIRFSMHNKYPCHLVNAISVGSLLMYIIEKTF